MKVRSIEAKLNAFGVITRIKWRMHCIPRFLLIMHLVWTAEFFSQNMTRPSSRIPSRKGWGEVPACRSDGRRDFPLCFFHSFTLYFNFFVSCCLSPWFHPLIFLRTSTVQPSPFSFSLLLSFFFFLLFFIFIFMCLREFQKRG